MALPTGMTKSQLIERLDEAHPHLTRELAEKVVNTIFGEITNALARGERVELRGFATFWVKTRQARVGRNPRTGEQVSVPEKKVPHFKPGKNIKDRLMSGGA